MLLLWILGCQWLKWRLLKFESMDVLFGCVWRSGYDLEVVFFVLNFNSRGVVFLDLWLWIGMLMEWWLKVGVVLGDW